MRCFPHIYTMVAFASFAFAALSGKEYLACQALNLDCGDYKECTRSDTTLNGVVSWECTDKSAGDQLAVFIANGPSSETPGWVWAVVALSSFFIVLLVAFLACEHHRTSLKLLKLWVR